MKLLHKFLTAFLFLVVSFSLAIANPTDLSLANADGFERYPHQLYFHTINKKPVLEWKHDNSGCIRNLTFELRGWHRKRAKYYALEDLDGDDTDLTATIRLPYTGHWWVELNACCVTREYDRVIEVGQPETEHIVVHECTDWGTSSFDHHTAEPIGWWMYAEPAPVTGGGID